MTSCISPEGYPAEVLGAEVDKLYDVFDGVKPGAFDQTLEVLKETSFNPLRSFRYKDHGFNTVLSIYAEAFDDILPSPRSSFTLTGYGKGHEPDIHLSTRRDYLRYRVVEAVKGLLIPEVTTNKWGMPIDFVASEDGRFWRAPVESFEENDVHGVGVVPFLAREGGLSDPGVEPIEIQELTLALERTARDSK